MQAIRIVEIPDCKMVSSGVGMFGDENFDAFHAWFSALPRTHESQEFLFSDEGRFHWLYIYNDRLNVPERFTLIDFKGGLYAVATDIDGQTDYDALFAAKLEFLKANGFEEDDSRYKMGNAFTPPKAAAVMGYSQMNYYTPIRVKD